MKLNNLIQARNIISRFSQEELSANLAYKLMKFLKMSDNEDIFYNEKLTAIIQQYAEKDAEGKYIKEKESFRILKDKVDECRVALQELNDLQVDKPSISLYLAELEELKLSIKEMAYLDEFIIEEE